MSKKFKLRWHVGYSADIQSAIVIVDEKDANFLRIRPYRVLYDSKNRAKNVVHTLDSGKKIYSLAREIMNAKEGEKVVHINRDALDCRRGNMRIEKDTVPIERHSRKHIYE